MGVQYVPVKCKECTYLLYDPSEERVLCLKGEKPEGCSLGRKVDDFLGSLLSSLGVDADSTLVKGVYPTREGMGNFLELLARGSAEDYRSMTEGEREVVEVEGTFRPAQREDLPLEKKYEEVVQGFYESFLRSLTPEKVEDAQEVRVNPRRPSTSPSW